MKLGMRKTLVEATALSLMIGSRHLSNDSFSHSAKMEREHPSSGFAFERMCTKCSDN